MTRLKINADGVGALLTEKRARVRVDSSAETSGTGVPEGGLGHGLGLAGGRVDRCHRG
jgi:hypothetical protein